MGLGQLFWNAYQGYLFVCAVFLFSVFLYNNTGFGFLFLILCTLPMYVHMVFQHALGSFWAPIVEEVAMANNDMFVGFANHTQTFVCVLHSIATNMQNLAQC